MTALAAMQTLGCCKGRVWPKQAIFELEGILSVLPLSLGFLVLCLEALNLILPPGVCSGESYVVPTPLLNSLFELGGEFALS